MSGFGVRHLGAALESGEYADLRICGYANVRINERPPTNDQRLSPAHCPLPTVPCPLSTVHCPLPTVHCPLSTAPCPLPALQYNPP